MLINNRINRYPNNGYNITTVWDFINEFAGNKSEQKGKLDIVVGYFTIRALAMLYNNVPKDDDFRIVSSEMIKSKDDDNQIIDLLNGDNSIKAVIELDQYAKDAKAFLERNNVHIKAITRAFCHAKAYMFHNSNPRGNSFYMTGSSNLTDAGLGLKKTSNVELNIGDSVALNNDVFNDICAWFETSGNSPTTPCQQIPKIPRQ